MLRRVMSMQSGGESCYSRLTNTTGARRCAGTVRVSTTQRCRGQRECGRREGVVSEKWRRCFIGRGDTKSTAVQDGLHAGRTHEGRGCTTLVPCTHNVILRGIERPCHSMNIGRQMMVLNGSEFGSVYPLMSILS